MYRSAVSALALFSISTARGYPIEVRFGFLTHTHTRGVQHPIQRNDGDITFPLVVVIRYYVAQ